MGRKLTVASLFSGCGGTDLGLIGGFHYLNKEYQSNNVEIIYANDIEPSACAIFKDNFGIEPDCRDIHSVSKNDILPEGGSQNIDIITGGFPCQSFSIVAQNPKRLGIKDPKGQLFFEMCRIIRECKPKCFIAENVKGLLSANNGEAFPLILDEFKKCGYEVSSDLIHAVEYGIPQKRDRIFIIGFRTDLKLSYNFDLLKGTEETVPLSAVIEDDVPEKYYFSQKAVEGMKKNRECMNKGRAQDITKPCNTVGSHLSKVSLNSTDPVLQVGERYRRFTPREVARIQSFPDSFILSGQENKQYLALGNAIPPVLMWHISQQVCSLLRG